MSVIELEKDAQAQQSSAESLAVSALGQGYDSVLGKTLSTAVAFKEPTPTGGASSVHFWRITDLETLAKTLDVSQSLSVTYGDIASGSEKTDFVSNLNLTTYSVSIMVHAKHGTGTYTLTDFALKDGIPAPKTHEERVQFFNGYGDSFVSSLTLGGEYIAVYAFYSRSEQEQTELVAEMQAAGLWDGVSVDANLQTKISNFTSSTNTRTTFTQIVIGLKDPSLPASDKICEFGQEFLKLPLTAPAILRFETTGYEKTSPVIIGGFGNIPKNRRYFIGTSVIDGLTKSLVAVRQLSDQIGWLRSINQFYGYGGDSILDDAKKKADSDLAKINGQIELWESDPDRAEFPPLILESLKLGTPSLNYTFHQSEFYGGDGGAPFDDVDTSTYLQSQTRIAKVQLQTGSWVDCLIVTYTDNSPKTWTTRHGGGGGSLSAILEFNAGEFVSQIYGATAQPRLEPLLIGNLNFVSTGGGSVGGGKYTSEEEARVIKWPVPSGSVVLGFGGRSGTYLDQVLVYYATFAPAKWSKLSA
jgi:hypothetical protein